MTGSAQAASCFNPALLSLHRGKSSRSASSDPVVAAHDCGTPTVAYGKQAAENKHCAVFSQEVQAEQADIFAQTRQLHNSVVVDCKSGAEIDAVSAVKICEETSFMSADVASNMQTDSYPAGQRRQESVCPALLRQLQTEAGADTSSVLQHAGHARSVACPASWRLLFCMPHGMTDGPACHVRGVSLHA